MTTTMTAAPARPASDRPEKRERLLALLDRHEASDTLMLTSSEALAWYLDGARVGIAIGAAPVLAVAVRRGGDTVYAFANELERLVAEELPADIDTVAVPWHETLLPVGLRPGSPGVLHEQEVLPELRAARAALLPLELTRYRRLCAEVAGVFSEQLPAATSDLTERELAADIGARVLALGAEPLVTLVAGESRLGHRHPLPTSATLGNRAMVVVCARRHGMIANVTRWVRFTAPSAQELDLQQRMLRLESDIFAATRSGRALGEVFADLAAAYATHGFAPEEWTRHHQGGPTGYVGRDPRATPLAPDLVEQGQAFAWNPTAPGAKVEDTVLLGDDGIEVLSHDPRWPSIEYAGLQRPDELQL